MLPQFDVAWQRVGSFAGFPDFSTKLRLRPPKLDQGHRVRVYSRC